MLLLFMHIHTKRKPDLPVSHILYVVNLPEWLTLYRIFFDKHILYSKLTYKEVAEEEEENIHESAMFVFRVLWVKMNVSHMTEENSLEGTEMNSFVRKLFLSSCASPKSLNIWVISIFESKKKFVFLPWFVYLV